MLVHGGHHGASLCRSPSDLVLSRRSVVVTSVGVEFSWAPSVVVWALLVFSPLMKVVIVLSFTVSSLVGFS